MEVKNIFMTKSCDIEDSERMLIIMTWLGHDGLHSVQKLAEEKIEKFKSSVAILNIPNDKLRCQHNETILSLQYCKLSREEHESAKDQMGQLGIKANECKYKKYDRYLKEQFLNGINDKMMTAEIIKELTMLRRTTDMTSKWVLTCAKRKKCSECRKQYYPACKKR